jgi:hypothetical protein
VRQAFFDIDTPAVDPHEAARVREPASDLTTEGTVQSRGVHFAPPRPVEHFERTALLIVTFNVSEARQSAVFIHQIVTHLHRLTCPLLYPDEKASSATRLPESINSCISFRP